MKDRRWKEKRMPLKKEEHGVNPCRGGEANEKGKNDYRKKKRR